MNIRVGQGFDSHRFVEGRKLILGGVEIPYEKGLLGHSDADALTHAVIDAILGAMAEGDIGAHFPDTDPQYKNASSLRLLKQTLELCRDKGFEVVNIDATIICQAPKLRPHIESMRASLVNAGLPSISIKAKTNEGMGFIGRREGLAAIAVCLLQKH